MFFGRQMKLLAARRKLFERDKLMRKQRVQVHAVQVRLVRCFLDEYQGCEFTWTEHVCLLSSREFHIGKWPAILQPHSQAFGGFPSQK